MSLKYPFIHLWELFDMPPHYPTPTNPNKQKIMVHSEPDFWGLAFLVSLGLGKLKVGICYLSFLGLIYPSPCEPLLSTLLLAQ